MSRTPVIVLNCLLALVAGPVAATTYLTLADTTGSQGTTTIVPLLYRSSGACAGMEMVLNYDRGQLEFLRIEPRGVLSHISDVISYEYTDGKVAIVIFDANGANFSASSEFAPFLDMFFGIKEDASGGFTPLFLTEAAAIRPDLSYDDVQIVNAGVVSVVLANFGGQSSAEGITLSWEVDARAISGFILERRLLLNSNWLQINEQPIGVNGSTGARSQYSYLDTAVETGAIYVYQLSAIDFEQTATILGHATVEHSPFLPTRLDISNNYPNPFNPSTRFRIDVPKTQKLDVRVYDLSGRKVRELVNGSVVAGRHVIVWDGTDHGGRSVASGIYFCRMQGDSFEKTVKIMMLK